MIDKEDSHVLEILNLLTETDDKILFRTVINKLSGYDLEQIENRKTIEEKINELMPEANDLDKMYLNNYLKKQVE